MLNSSNSKLKTKLKKFKYIKIVYWTPKKQLWGVLSNGKKKCIIKKIVDEMELHNFLEKKNIISYKDSLKLNKNIRFIILTNSIEIVLKKKKINIFFKKKKNFIKNQKFHCLSKKKIIFAYFFSCVAKKFDQFYTKKSSAKLCIEWYFRLVKINKYSDLIIEPSAGSGSFYNFIFNATKNKIFLDLYPKHFAVIRQDFLKFEINNNFYNNIHIIGNPPFKQISSFIQKASKLGDFIGFVLPLSYKKDSRKNRFPLNFHCIFSQDLPKNSFIYEGKIKNIPTVFQIWKKESYNREIQKKLISRFFNFVKKNENPCLSFRRVGSKSGWISKDINKTQSTHYFLKLKKNISLDLFLEEYKNVNFLHNNTVGQKSISKQELIYEINKMILPDTY